MEKDGNLVCDSFCSECQRMRHQRWTATFITSCRYHRSLSLSFIIQLVVLPPPLPFFFLLPLPFSFSSTFQTFVFLSCSLFSLPCFSNYNLGNVPCAVSGTASSEGCVSLQLMPKRLVWVRLCYNPAWARLHVCKASLVPYNTYVNTYLDVSAVSHLYCISWIKSSIVRFTLYLATGFRVEEGGGIVSIQT